MNKVYISAKRASNKGITKTLVKHLLRNFTVWRSQFNRILRCSFTIELKVNIRWQHSILEKCHFLNNFCKKNSIKTQKSSDRPVKKYLVRPAGIPVRSGILDRTGPAVCRYRFQLWRIQFCSSRDHVSCRRSLIMKVNFRGCELYCSLDSRLQISQRL